MRVADLPANADLGFTDALRPGVGRAVGGRLGDLACSTTGTSRVVTIAPGVVWVQDAAGTFTGIANALLRQVLANATTVTLAANADPTNSRVDLVVATVGGRWGSAPTIAVRQGAATASATARNLLGAAALAAGDVPLLAIAVPPASANLPAVAALVSSTASEDCRVLAGDLTPAGTEKNFAGSLPPVGYKVEDGGDYNGRADGPWAEMVAAIGTAHGQPVAGRINLPNTIGRTRVGSGTGGTADDRAQALTTRALGAKFGRENHPLAVTEMPPHDHGGVTGADSPDHAHTITPLDPGSVGFGDPVGRGNPGGTSSGPVGTSGASARHAHVIGSQGGGGVHPNTQPSVATPAIVKF